MLNNQLDFENERNKQKRSTINDALIAANLRKYNL